MASRLLPPVVVLAATALAACSEAARPAETSAMPPVTSVPVPPHEAPSVVVAEPVVARADEPAAPAAAGSAVAIAPRDVPPGPATGCDPTGPAQRRPPPVAPHYDPASLGGRLGRIRPCYEAALRADPNLRGCVNVTFIIGKDGSVVHATENGSTVKDPVMRACVVRAFYGLSFPAPETGTVTVTYPILFTPPDE
jgi:hypothetical protein